MRYILKKQKLQAFVRLCFFVCLVFFALPETVSAQSDSSTLAAPSALDMRRAHLKRGVSQPAPQVTVTSDKKMTRVHTTDSALQRRHNPKIAIALSAVLPGAGQVYNHKWWKVPIVYAGLGAAGYFIYFYAKETRLYTNEFKARLNGNTDLLRPEFEKYSNDNILSLKNDYRRSMEIAIAAGAIIYLLNILDATVDAHLFYFDISDDLSLQVAPYLQHNRFSHGTDRGIGLTMKF